MKIKIFLFLVFTIAISIFILEENHAIKRTIVLPKLDTSFFQKETSYQEKCFQSKDKERLSSLRKEDIVPIGNNTIKGTIDLPKLGSSFLQKGTSYQNKSARSPEKKRIDELNAPEKNIYISLHPLDFEPKIFPTPDAEITQREKTFFPNVIAVTRGTTVHFKNEDEHYHNVFSLTRRARFNIGRRSTGNVYGQQVKKLGVIKLGCDIHDEMSGVIWSLNTPYFTKIEEDRTYQIADLPDGRYQLQVYHPAIQKYTEEIVLSGNKIVTKNIKISPKA